jgi:hypothetical protein
MLRRCTSSTTTTHLTHTRCGTNSFSTHCQIASEPVFWWKEVRTLKNSQLVCTIPWSWSSRFLVVRTRNDIGEFWADQWLSRITAQCWEWFSGDLSETRNCLKQYALLCNEELTIVQTRMGITQSICCGDNTNITLISAGTGTQWELVLHTFDFRNPC